ncbi:MAG: hypothetical protein ACXITR_13445 [Cyanobacterium sp.]
MRKIRCPQEFSPQDLRGFCIVTKKDLASAISNKLTASQWKLWAYLMMLDPFADHKKDGERIYKPLPPPQKIAEQIGLCYDTVIKDMRKLRKYNLYDYKVTGWQGYNESAHHAKGVRHKKAKTDSQQALGLINPDNGLNNPTSGLNNPDDGLNNPPNGLNNPKLIPEVLPCKDYSSPHTIQTKQTKHTFSEQETERKNLRKEDQVNQSNSNERNFFPLEETSTTVSCHSHHLKHYIPERSIVERTDSVNVYSNYNWIPPEGDWKVSNRLDPHFHEWLAKKWAKKFNIKIHEAKANVTLCFMNSPAKLPIQWSQYQQESLAKVDNVRVRLNHGYTISPQEQVNVLSRINAINPCNQSSSSPRSVNNSVMEDSSSSTEKIPVNLTALKKLSDFMAGFSTSKVVGA